MFARTLTTTTRYLSRPQLTSSSRRSVYSQWKGDSKPNNSLGGMTQKEYTAEEIFKKDPEVLLELYGKSDLLFTHGDGPWLYTHDQKKYLDCYSGIAVTSLGHSNLAWVQAVQDQAGKLAHLSNFFHNEWGVPIATRLVNSCNFADKVFLCNTGAEATEAALKMSRKVAKQIHEDKVEIVAFKGSFHGRTMGAVSMTYKEIYRTQFAPLVPTVHFAEFNSLEDASKLITDRTAAVILEPIQGEGGIRVATPEFLKKLRALCDQHQAALAFDEVQCGLGRTGSLWGHQSYPEFVEPDILAFAKPIAGGLPMGGVLLNKRVAEQIKKGDHGTTFGGGPIACRAATVVFDQINRPEFLKHVKESGEYILETLRALNHPKIKEVRGLGMMIGIELTEPVAPLLKYAQERGFLMIGAGENVIRFCPPLIMERPELDSALQVIAEGLKECK